MFDFKPGLVNNRHLIPRGNGSQRVPGQQPPPPVELNHMTVKQLKNDLIEDLKKCVPFIIVAILVVLGFIYL